MTPLTAAVVGVRGIGGGHARILSELPEYTLVGICDNNAEVLAAADTQAPRFSDFDRLMQEARPEVVVIATPNASHAALTVRAVELGARGVYCEKPMSVDLRDAYRMVEACRSANVALAVNHQRRLRPEIVRMRELIEAGEIGELEMVRTANAGDVLSDGTHAIDSLRFLVGDAPVEWVAGQVFRKPYAGTEGGTGYDVANGRRFGHPVEDSAFAVLGFANGVRAEMSFGELFPKGRWYQDYEAIGTAGRLWRPSDGQQPPLRRDTGRGWEAVEVAAAAEPELHRSFRRFAETVHHGVPHPLDGTTHGLAAMEIVAAIYESARTHQRVAPGVGPTFPLERMVEEGAFREVSQ